MSTSASNSSLTNEGRKRIRSSAEEKEYNRKRIKKWRMEKKLSKPTKKAKTDDEKRKEKNARERIRRARKKEMNEACQRWDRSSRQPFQDLSNNLPQRFVRLGQLTVDHL